MTRGDNEAISDSPIPYDLQVEFIGYMDAHNDQDAPDGAWFCMLEQGAAAFMFDYNIKGCENSAAHQYLRLVAEDESESAL